jgi:uncharacterized protein with GYD domain
MKGYVLINTDIGEELNVVKTLRSVKSQSGTGYISGVDLTFGPYDIVATIEAADLGELGRIVTLIRSAAGVCETVTCVAIEVTGPAVPVSGLGAETPSIPVG